MRAGIVLSVVLLLAAPSLAAQGNRPSREIERFDVSGLPSTPTTDVERQILLFVKVHRKGDLTDATRIHMMLAQYYKDRGDATRADDCNRLAADAYNATATAPPETAGAAGHPPFERQATFRRTFVYTDEQMIEHLWDFYADGTFSHMANGTIETGWYTRDGRDMRLWSAKPKVDRTVQFELIGPDGSEGAVMGGVRMKPAT